MRAPSVQQLRGTPNAQGKAPHTGVLPLVHPLARAYVVGQLTRGGVVRLARVAPLLAGHSTSAGSRRKGIRMAWHGRGGTLSARRYARTWGGNRGRWGKWCATVLVLAMTTFGLTTVGAPRASAAQGPTPSAAASALPTDSASVDPGPLDHLVLSPSGATVTAGDSQAYTAEGFDSDGNSLGDVTSATTFTISGGGSCAGASCSATVPGTYTVTGTDGTATGTAKLVVTTLAPGDIYTVAGNGTGGYGGDGGPATSAELQNAVEVALDPNGDLLIVEEDYQNRVRLVARSASNPGYVLAGCPGTCTWAQGDIYTVAGNGTGGYSGDGGPAVSAQLYDPAGVAVDSSGNVLIADYGNQRVRVLAMSASDPGYTLAGCPGTCSWAQGDIYTVVGDGTSGYGMVDIGDGGPATSAELSAPESVAVDSSGNLVLGESLPRVRVVAMSASDPGYALAGCPGTCSWTRGDIYTVAGDGTSGGSGDGGPATSAEITNPTDVVVDLSGDLVINDVWNARVRLVAVSASNPGYALSGCPGTCTWAQGDIYTVAGDGTWEGAEQIAGAGYSGDGGPATSAELGGEGTDDVVVDASGNLVIADGANFRVRVVAVSASDPGYALAGCPGTCTWAKGDIYTVAGNGSQGYSGDGGPATSAELNSPLGGIAVDASGNLVIADVYNNRVREVLVGSSGTLDHLALSPSSATVTAGDSQSYAAAGFDANGNSLGDVTSATTFTISGGGTCAGTSCGATVPGTYTVTGTDGTATGTATLYVESAGDWPQFRDGPAHTGHNAAETTLSPSDLADLGVAWTAAIGEATYSSATVADGVVYIGAQDGTVDGRLYAFPVGCASGGGTCTPLWTAVTTLGIQATPAVADGVVYVGSGSEDGKLYAFAVGCASGGGTCSPLWTANVGDVRSSPAVSGGVVYITSYGSGELYAFAVGCASGGGTCSPLWTANVGMATRSSPAVADGVVYVGSFDDDLYAFPVGCRTDGGTCSPLWIGATGSYIESSPAVSGGVVYVGSEDGNLYAFPVGCRTDGGTCLPLWTGATGGIIDISSPAVANGAVYVGSDDGKLYAFPVGCRSDGGTCTPLWTGSTGGQILSSPTVSGGVVYLSSYDGNLYAFGLLPPGVLDHLVLSPSSSTVTAGATQTYTAQGFDGYGNSLGDVTSATTFTVGGGGSCVGASCSATLPGTYTVTGTDGTATGTATLQVTPAIITVTVSGSQGYGSSSPAFTPTYSAPSGVSVTGTVICSTVNGGSSIGPSLSAGSSYTIDGPSCSGLSAPVGYSVAYVGGIFTVNQAAPAITWPVPAAITYGTALGSAQLDATASVPGTFSYSPAAGTVLHPGTGQVLEVTFTPTDTTDYASASASTTITVNQATPAITWPVPAAITYGTALGSAQLDATALVPGTFTYSPAAGTVLPAGSQTLTVNFTPTDTTDYTSASASTTLTVGFTQSCITTTYNGSLTIAKGQALCIGTGGKVTGSVSVSPGGSLWVDGGSIGGSLSSSGASALSMAGATLTGSLSVTGSTGPVVVGGPSGSGVTIGGSVSITSNTKGVTFDNDHVTGSLSISANAGGLAVTGNVITGSASVTANTGGIVFTNNAISGSLAIIDNSGGFQYSGNSVKGSVTNSGNS